MANQLVVGTIVEVNRAYNVWERAWLGSLNDDSDDTATVVFCTDWDRWDDVDGQETPVSANGASVLQLAGVRVSLANVRPLEEGEAEEEDEQDALADDEETDYSGPFFLVQEPFRECVFQLGVGDVAYLDFVDGPSGEGVSAQPTLILARVSFDGWGCCNCGVSGDDDDAPRDVCGPMDAADAASLRAMVATQQLDEGQVRRIVQTYCQRFRSSMWEDALIAYGLQSPVEGQNLNPEPL
jgi:hypothetical protein